MWKGGWISIRDKDGLHVSTMPALGVGRGCVAHEGAKCFGGLCDANKVSSRV